MADCKIVYYNSSTSSIQLGDFLYQNQAQTIPAGAGFYAWTNDDKWYQTDAEGVVIDSGSCSPIGNIWTPTLISSILMGCISSSYQISTVVTNVWRDAYYTSSAGGYFVAFTGTGSADSALPAIQTTTASFQAYDFNRTYNYFNNNQTFTSYPSVNYDNAGGRISGSITQMTSQIWGAIDFTNSGSQNGLLRLESGDDTWSVYTEYSGSSNKLYITNVSQSVVNTTTMSLAGGNYPVDRLSLYTIRVSGSNFQFLSGSTIIGNVNHQKQFNINSTWEVNIGTNAGAPPVPSAYFNAFRGYMNAGFLYTSSLSLERIEQNTYSLINGYTSSINLRGCIEPIPNYPSLNGLGHSFPYGGISYLGLSCLQDSPECGNWGLPSGSTVYEIDDLWFDGYQSSSYPGAQFVSCSTISYVSGNCQYRSNFDNTGPAYNNYIAKPTPGVQGPREWLTYPTTTASFQAYDFTYYEYAGNDIESLNYRSGSMMWTVTDNQNLAYGPLTAIQNSTNTSNGFTYQVWGALNLATASNCGIFSVASGQPGQSYKIFTKTSGSLDTDKQFVLTKYSSSSDTVIDYAVSMSVTGANWPIDRLTLFTFIVSGSTFSAYSGSTLVGSKALPQPFTTQVPSGSNSVTRALIAQIRNEFTSSLFGGTNYAEGWRGFVNHQLIYNRPIGVNEIQQNLNAFLTNTTSSIDRENTVKPPIATPTTTTTSTTTTTTTSTTTTTTSTSTTTTLGPQIITRGLSSYLNFRNFYSASIENNDLWYDSVQLVSESACSRVIGIDSADEGCGENRPDCPVFLSTGSFNAWDWPNVFNCNKSVFFPTGAFASSSNQTYVFYGAWDKDSNYGFVRNRNYQTSLQRANKIYSSGSNIVLETYWNNGSTHTLDLPITASTFTSSSLSMLTVRVENGNTASVFQNGNLILTKETSSLNFQSQNAGYTYWLDSDDVSDYTMFAHSMLIYTASLTNNEISALSTAINNNITGSY
jgi:hypothetical protein